MYLISHRGNINGIQKSKENDPNYINKAIESGFDVEVDVRYTGSKFFLGHDNDQYEIDKDFLLNEKIWCHAKTNTALSALHEIGAHYFWHQEDDYTLTSKNYIWAYPGKHVIPVKKSIAVMPEIYNNNIKNFSGICSDYSENYK